MQEGEIGFGLLRGLIAERFSLDRDDTAAMPEAVEQCVDHAFGLEDVVPVLELEVGGDDCWAACFVAFFHELEKAIHLLGSQGEIAQFVEKEQVVATQSHQ